MTVQPVGPSTEVAVQQEQVGGPPIGLGDMNQGDLSIPRLQIVNKKGVFKDSLSNTEFSQIPTIILGLVKQRTLWPEKVGTTVAKPMCRSNDFEHGFVNMKQPDHPFPWPQSGLGQQHVLPREDGQLTFNCSDCSLKTWKGQEKPPCNEVWTIPLLMDPYQNGSWVPAVLNLSKTNIPLIKKYLGGFVATNDAAFTTITWMELMLLKRGDNDYSNIVLKRGERTDSAMWGEWTDLYMEMREFLTQEPRVFEENVAAGPPAAPQPQAAAPVAQAAPVVIVQSEPQVQAGPAPAEYVQQQDPWAQPAQNQPMQAPAAMQQPVATPPQAAQPVAAPVQAAPAPQPEPTPVQAAVAPPVTAPPVVAPVPTPVPAPAPQAAPAPAQAPAPAPATMAPQPQAAQVAQADPTTVQAAQQVSAPIAYAQVPTSPAIPQTSPPAAPGPDGVDELPF